MRPQSKKKVLGFRKQDIQDRKEVKGLFKIETKLDLASRSDRIKIMEDSKRGIVKNPKNKKRKQTGCICLY